MPSPAIYWFGPSWEDDYPQINWKGGAASQLDAVDAHFKGDAGTGAAPDLGISFATKRRKPKWRHIDVINLSPGLGVSTRCREVLQNLGVPGMVFVPFSLDGEPFHLLITRRCVDCLDRSKSVLKYFDSDKTQVMSIERHFFHRRSLKDPDLFVIPEESGVVHPWWQTIYLTGRAREALESAGLLGLRFSEVEDHRDPFGSGRPPQMYENKRLGLRMAVPDTWALITASPGGRKRQPSSACVRTGGYQRYDDDLPVTVGDLRYLLTAEFRHITWPIKSYASIELSVWRADRCDKFIREGIEFTKREDANAETGKCRIGGVSFEFVHTGIHRFLYSPVDDTLCLYVRMMAGPEHFPAAMSVLQTLERTK